MARSLLLVSALLGLSSLAAAMGPHYPASHDADLDSLAKRALELQEVQARQVMAGGHGDAMTRRSKHKNRLRRRCKATSSSSGSTSSATNSTSSASSSSGTVGGASSSTGSNSTAAESSAAGIVSSALSSLISSTGITAFIDGTNGPAIGSWFNTDSGTDSTNGHSWCGYPYDNETNGFAPDVSLMLSNFGGDYTKAATAYCGLEAVVTGKDGRTATMYIVDGCESLPLRLDHPVPC